uniref:Reductase_C domain-containing protein n=1 Tax=Haemonchus placei TaxID=6290 RepID=A0A0N4VVV2_HAEPC
LPLWDIDSVNIQHFQTAQTHGQLLGYSIVGRPFPHEVIPFFWTTFFSEIGLRYAGCSEGAQHTIVHGSLAELNFAKYYLKDDVVVAVASAGPIPTAIQFVELFKRKITVTREDVEKNTSNDWMTLIDE